MRRRVMEEGFRPRMPSSWNLDEHTWLTNRDIANVMKQYEALVPDFAFVGVFPRDFELRLSSGQCVSPKMCDLDYSVLWQNGKRQLGTVFNLDTHLGGGSHWVCMYASLDPSTSDFGAYYYDSVARTPPREVESFMSAMKRRMGDVHGEHVVPSFQIRYNTVRRQFENTECGIFVMFFLVCCMSRRVPFDKICRSMGYDANIHALRRVFFRS